jgi:hypothetical protein
MCAGVLISISGCVVRRHVGFLNFRSCPEAWPGLLSCWTLESSFPVQGKRSGVVSDFVVLVSRFPVQSLSWIMKAFSPLFGVISSHDGFHSFHFCFQAHGQSQCSWWIFVVDAKMSSWDLPAFFQCIALCYLELWNLYYSFQHLYSI